MMRRLAHQEALPSSLLSPPVEATVANSSTVTVFDGELYVSMLYDRWTSGCVYLTFGSPGWDTSTVSVQVGKAFAYYGNRYYSIRVMSLDTRQATVAVSRGPAPPPGTTDSPNWGVFRIGRILDATEAQPSSWSLPSGGVSCLLLG